MSARTGKIISLFSGAMGLDLGLEQAGFRTAVTVEINRWAIETIRRNRPNLPLITKSVTDISARTILRAGKLHRGAAAIVTAGPCCQSFSTAGSRRSLEDTRGALFRHFIRIVRETQPRFFVMENVRGIVSAAIRHRPLNDRGPGFPPLSRDEEFGSAMREILRELAGLGYYVVFGVLNAADFGVPQKRARVIFIGSRDGEEITLPMPTHSGFAENGRPEWVTLKEAVGDFTDDAPEFVEFSAERKELLRQLKAGENWRNLPVALQKKALGAASKSWGGRSGFCRRLSWDQPAPTLTTAPDGRATTLCHPTRLRPLSIKECAVLQQFPARWQFCGSVRQKYMQLGNAVPTGLGRAIGRSIRRAMSQTERCGLPADAQERQGLVVCGDRHLAEQLTRGRKTQLHPPRLRKNPDPIAARVWLAQRAA